MGVKRGMVFYELVILLLHYYCMRSMLSMLTRPIYMEEPLTLIERDQIFKKLKHQTTFQ